MAGNSLDINGNPRSVTLTDGVPDIGAYEFTPASTPPAATATPASPAANGTQVFRLGQDTVATIAWGASVPASITIRQYTGTQPPSISSLSGNNMYFYTDISIPSGTYGHTSNLYYKDPWMASIGSEHALRLAKKDGANAWVAYASPGSTVNATRNIISTTGTNNFGLHTGIDQGDNAGMNAVVSPVKPFCTGNQSVTVQVKNTGNNVLNNVQIGWMVDGVPQTPVGYNTPINTLGSGLGNTATVTLGNVVFGAAPRTIQAWTYSPNGNNDAFKTDDTVTVVLRSSLNGTYTIGGTTPNYTTIAAAVTDLNLYGVCGPVVFDIRNGTYTAQTTLKPVIGASAVNTITFKSETNNAANVTVQASLSSSNNFLIKFDSAEHFIFRLLTLKSTNTSYGYILNYAGTASHNTVRDCDIQIAGTSASGRAAVYANTTFFGTGNTIRDNIVTGGYYGVYLNGTTSNYLNGFTVENNNFSNIYYYGVYAYYTNRFKYLNNSLDINTSSSTCYGANLYYCDKLDLSGNTMNVTKSSGSLYGMYLYSSHGDVADSLRYKATILRLRKQAAAGRCIHCISAMEVRPVPIAMFPSRITPWIARLRTICIITVHMALQTPHLTAMT